MKLLNNIIQELLKKYVGGQVYFTALDKSIQHKAITDKLFSIAPTNNTIIVSGDLGNLLKEFILKKIYCFLKVD